MSRTVLITGAASGIGKGIAENLAGKNYTVIITDVNPEMAKQVSSQISSLGGNSISFELDVTQSASFDSLQQQLHQNDLTVDVIINNAGLQYVAPIEEFSLQKWLLLQDVMVTGVFRAIKHFMSAMKQQNFGRIINIGSIHSLVASPYKTAYVAAKHALVGLSKVVALETAAHDITINTLCPAYVKTALLDNQIADQAKNNGITEQQVIDNIMLKPMPKKAFIEIDELAETSHFLISDAAKNITAQTIALDGGWTAQ